MAAADIHHAVVTAFVADNVNEAVVTAVVTAFVAANILVAVVAAD